MADPAASARGGVTLRSAQHREVGVHPGILGTAGEAGPPDLASPEGVAREVVRQAEGDLRVHESGPLPQHLFQRLAGVERPTRLEHPPGHPVTQIVVRRPQLQGALILLDRPPQGSRLGVGLGQLGVGVGQPGRDRRRQPVRGRRHTGRSPAERFLGLAFASQLGQDQTLVDQRLEVPRIELQRAGELLHRPLPLAQQGQRHAEQVVHVREGAAVGDDLLQQVHRPVVVLDREPLARPRQEALSLPGHTPPGTRKRTAGFPRETACAAGSRAPGTTW